MSKYNFDKVIDRHNKQSYKYMEADPNVLPMWVADMDFECFPGITEAISKRLQTPCYGYTYVPDEFFLAYVNYWKRHYSVNFEVKNCIYSTGVVASIDSILKHLVEKGKKVVVQTPVYHTFFHCIENNGLIVVENKLVYQNDEYKVDYDLLERQLSDNDVKAFIFCNPHNPTGYIYNHQEINKIAEICSKNDVILISDEIHSEIRDPGFNYHSMLEADEKYLDNVIVLLAGSKCFNIAGLHSSVAVVKNAELHEKVQAGIYADDIGEANYFACDANIAAFNDGDQWLDEMNNYIAKNRKFVEEFFEDSGLKIIKSHSTYLLWIDISKYSDDSEKFCDELKAKTGLWLSHGKQFRGDGLTFVRMNIATSFANVIDGCNRLKSFIEK